MNKYDKIMMLISSLAGDADLQHSHPHYWRAAAEILDGEKLVWSNRAADINFPPDDVLKGAARSQRDTAATLTGMVVVEHDGQRFFVDRLGPLMSCSARVYREGEGHQRELVGMFFWRDE